MVGVNLCGMCKKSPRKNMKLDHILDAKIKTRSNENEMISYFEAMQQLTGTELTYESSASHKICIDCQNRVRSAYEIRNDIIEAFELKNQKSVEVYQIVTTSTNDLKYIQKLKQDEQELVEITEVDDDYKLDPLTPDDGLTVYVESGKEETEEVEFFEVEQTTGDEDDGDGQIDAVTFLLEKRELFKDDQDKTKNQRRIHKCDVCEKTFKRKSNLVDHLRLHANLRMYKCEYCDKEFVQAGNYRSHLRIHTKERPYKCVMCPKTYNQSSALKVHIRNHTNEKNYVCDVCSKAFTNSSDLNKHKRVHDPSLKMKCDFCDKSFAQRVNLKNHILRHHTKK